MPDERSLAEVAADIVREAKLLIRQHLALASAELSDTARLVARSGIRLVLAISMALLGLGALGAAATLGIVSGGIEPWAAALMVGLASLVAAGVLGWRAVGAVRKESLLPNTVAALKGHLEEGVS